MRSQLTGDRCAVVRARSSGSVGRDAAGAGAGCAARCILGGGRNGDVAKVREMLDAGMHVDRASMPALRPWPLPPSAIRWKWPRATPAVAGGTLFVRGAKHVFAIGQKAAK